MTKNNHDRLPILVAEDNTDLRHYITLLLSDKYQIIAVENGQAAIEQLKSSGPPALIISDLMMPIMDGMALAKRVKGNKDWCLVPIVILTARQSTEIKIDALRIGVDDYLTKPFKEEELLVRIDNLIQNRSNRALSTEEEEEETLPINIAPTDLQWLGELEAIISNQLANPKFKLIEAASLMNMSYRRLQQKLKAITGLTPKQYQRSIKLARARELLKSGNIQTVTEVMYQLGFDNHHYFSKLYREAFGVMPSEELWMYSAKCTVLDVRCIVYGVGCEVSIVIHSRCTTKFSFDSYYFTKYLLQVICQHILSLKQRSEGQSSRYFK